MRDVTASMRIVAGAKWSLYVGCSSLYVGCYSLYVGCYSIYVGCYILYVVCYSPYLACYRRCVDRRQDVRSFCVKKETKTEIKTKSPDSADVQA